MDREDVFKNVAFGGAWSERILGVERRQNALARLRRAIEETAEEDLRADEGLDQALRDATSGLPKKDQLRISWAKALGMPDAYARASELARIYRLVDLAVGVAAKL